MPQKQRIHETATTTQLAASGSPGRYQVRIISNGVGSSGVYPAATIRDAVERGVWAKGTHVYLDHPDALENETRPERSLRDLIGVLDSDATLTDLDEGGVAADAQLKVYAPYRELVAEMADDIGLSIRATADIGTGKADGHEGKIVWRIHEALSVDLVTKAGRGGRILEVLESARSQAVETAANDRRDQLGRAVQTAYGDQDHYTYILDFDDAARLVWFDAEAKVWQQSYEPTLTDRAVTLVGTRAEVRPITTYHPVHSAGATEHAPVLSTKEASLMQIEDAQYAALNEAANRVPALEAERDAAIQRAEAAEADARKRAREAYTAMLDAALSGSTLPTQAQARVRENLSLTGDAEPPADAPRVIETAIKAEADYLAAVAPTASRGLGFNAVSANESGNRPARTRNAFGRTIKED